jgi:hypothetical protein
MVHASFLFIEQFLKLSASAFQPLAKRRRLDAQDPRSLILFELVDADQQEDLAQRGR